jgi:hypothetical protein
VQLIGRSHSGGQEINLRPRKVRVDPSGLVCATNEPPVQRESDYAQDKSLDPNQEKFPSISGELHGTAKKIVTLFNINSAHPKKNMSRPFSAFCIDQVPVPNASFSMLVDGADFTPFTPVSILFHLLVEL